MNKQDIEQTTDQSEDHKLALARLIDQQRVAPIDDLDALSDLWPADDDPDQLMQYILDERMQRRTLNL
jgi:hypothetical protein